MTTTRKYAGKTRGRPFRPGNAGRPKGARNKATRAMQDLLDGEAETITRKAIELALEGDTTALRLCMERLCPPRRERPAACSLPPVKKPDDVVTAMGAVLKAVADGDLTPSEGTALAGLVEHCRKAQETGQIATELAELRRQFEILRAGRATP